MKAYITAFICTTSLICGSPIFSQCLWRETVVNFNKEDENSKNLLGIISYKDSEFTDIVFIKKKQKEEVVYETIRLDDELFTVDKFEEADKDFAKSYFRGTSYTTTLPVVKTAIRGYPTKLRSVELKYQWNWLSGEYDLLSQSVKKNLGGNSVFSNSNEKRPFFYMAHSVDHDKEELMLVGKNSNYKDENITPRHTVYILKYNARLELISTKSFELEYPHHVIYSDNYNIDGNKLVMVLAPKTPSQYEKITDPEPHKYKLLVINEDGEVEKKIDFHTSSLRWKIDGVSFTEDEITVYGMGDQLISSPSAGVRSERSDYFVWWENSFVPAFIQIGIFKKNSSSSETKIVSFDAFEPVAKSVDNTPVSQWILEGKIHLHRFQKGNNGRFFLSGAAYHPRVLPITYTDFFFMSIDSTGGLNNLYSMKNPELKVINLNSTHRYPGESFVYESSNDPGMLLWTLKYVDKATSQYQYNSTTAAGPFGRTIVAKNVQYSPVMYKIDTRSGSCEECTDRLDKGFYLYGGFINQNNVALPHVELNTPGEWLLLGKKRQNSLWVGKIVW